MGKKRETIIPKAPAARILLNAGAKRVSADAVDAFVSILEEKAIAISQQAIRVARHAGRKTIHEGDIRLAVK